MKKHKGRNKSQSIDYPKYKLVIPIIICMYMIMSLFMSGINKKEILLIVASVSMVAWFIGENIFPDKIYKDEYNKANKLKHIQ